MKTVAVRIQSLDVLRGIAVLMILVYHNYAIRSEPPLLAFLARGVDLFFVLSGFLISGLLFSEYKASGNIRCWRFWIRRGFKIYPSFYALMLLTGLLIFRAHLPSSMFWHEIFFVQNYGSHFWTHTWSLAVEEHFYLVLPLLFLLLIKIGRKSRDPFRSLPVISIVLSIACLLLRMKVASAGGGMEQVAFPSHLRFDALFAGVTLGYFYHFNRPSFEEARKPWVLVVGLLMFLACVPLPYLPQLTFGYAAFVLIVAWTVNQTPGRFRFLSPMAWVGRYSYSIYLWHIAVFLLVQKAFPHSRSLLLYVGSSIVLGAIVGKAIEMPFLHLRDRFVPSTRRVHEVAELECKYEVAASR